MKIWNSHLKVIFSFQLLTCINFHVSPNLNPIRIDNFKTTKYKYFIGFGDTLSPPLIPVAIKLFNLKDDHVSHYLCTRFFCLIRIEQTRQKKKLNRKINIFLSTILLMIEKHKVQRSYNQQNKDDFSNQCLPNKATMFLKQRKNGITVLLQHLQNSVLSGVTVTVKQIQYITNKGCRDLQIFFLTKRGNRTI